MEQAPKPAEPAKPKSKKAMWAVIAVVIIVVVAVLGLYFAGYFGGTSKTAQITINDDGACASQSPACKFTPVRYNATVGSTVTWKNDGTVPHTVTFTGANPPSPTDTTLSSGQTVSVTFNTAGTYQYHCTIHLWMTANVTVT